MIKTFKYIACCLVGVLALLPLQAQNIIRPKIEGPGNLWVNSYNGVLFFELTDFETQSSAMPMKLRFYYNSSSSTINYGYGLGFSMGYEMRYREDAIGGVDIISGDGRTDHFTKYGDEYKSPAGVFSTLVRPTFDTYLLTTKDGTKYFFDSAHHCKVTAFEDRNGNRTTFNYQDSLLVEIKDAVGHTITLSYTDGLMTQASATFSPGKFKYEYDGLRRLRKRIDPMGNVTIYDYSRQNKLDEITDANGNKTVIAYNNSGMVSRLKTDVSDKSIRYDGDKTVFIDYVDSKNVYSYYRWDDKGRAIEKVGLCCGIQSTLRYDDNDNVAQLIDANGNATNYTYDEQGNMIELHDPLGYSEQFTYEPIFNQLSSYRDKNGNSYTFSYDAKGNLTTLNGPLGFNNNYSYNEHGWLTKVTDPNGGVTSTTYNTDGTKAKVVNADGGTIIFSYDSYGRLLSETDPMGNITSYAYDNLGRLTKITDALGNTSTKTYDKTGNIVRVLDATGNISSYTYDALGHLTSFTDAQGYVYSYEYDGRGNIISIINPLGVRQEAIYNERSKIESFTNGEGERTNYEYDTKGNLVALLQPNGNIISYEYDELNRLIEISDNMGLIALYEYDGNGNRISQVDGLDRKRTFTYDELNRKSSEVLPSGDKRQYQYDAVGNLISVTDALGNVTSYTYDAMNRQTSQTNAVNAKTRFAYDANGNVTRVTDAKGNSTTYSYDALNQKTAITFANGKSLIFTYNKLGRVSLLKDRAGNEFRYNYDTNGNLLKKTYPDGSTDTYSYDASSRMLTAINKDASVLFTYDRAGRLLSETLNGKTTKYSYDIANGKQTIVYQSGMTVIKQLNSRGLISSILENGDEMVVMDYNTAGQKTRQIYNNGISTDYYYNENGWLSSIITNNDIMNYAMDYDKVGNIIHHHNVLNASSSESYGYDVINQLVSFKRGSSIDNSYQYDLLGNRTRMSENGLVSNYLSNNVNAYTSITGGLSFTPQYDYNGNLLNDDKHTFNYDFNRRIINVDENDISYKYDALGRRIAKNNTLYYYMGVQMVEEVTEDCITSYLYGNNIDEILLMKRSNDKYYYHTNHLGSTVALTNSDGYPIERIEYDVFGKPALYDSDNNSIFVSNVGNMILYTGREYDYESGNYYMRERTLTPTLGRFLQFDKLNYVDGYNDYAYVGNRVTYFVDRMGLTCDLPDDLTDDLPDLPESFCERHPVICKILGTDGDNFCSSHPILCSIAGFAPYVGPFVNAYSGNGSFSDGDPIGGLIDYAGAGVGLGSLFGLIDAGLATSIGAPLALLGLWVHNFTEGLRGFDQFVDTQSGLLNDYSNGADLTPEQEYFMNFNFFGQ